MKNAGATGAIPRTDLERLDEHSNRYYEEIRKRKHDVAAIAHNTGVPIEDIEKIKQHIFVNEYDLGEDGYRRFDPDYDIAVSWQRLVDGKDIQEMDIVLLNHELFEYNLMNEQKLSYKEAHKKAAELYNYQMFTDALNRKAGLK